MDYFTNEKHYNTINNYYKHKYNSKVFKISLNADFTCPNKDGKKGYGGCIYCSKLGSGDFAGDKNSPLKEQFFQIKKVMQEKWNEGLYVSYLQANSNTYSDYNTLKQIYNEVISYDEKIIGLSIATRCDCFTNEIFDLLNEMNQKTDLTIELGLQTINEDTSKLINRCHDLIEFEETVNKLISLNIKVVVHIINGLPHETKEDMLNTCRYLNKFKLFGVKIHMLYVTKDTKLAKYYEETKFKILSLEEYVDIVVNQLRILNKEFIILRLTGDANRDELIEPIWSLKKLVVMNEIDKLMRKNNYYQGDSYEI